MSERVCVRGCVRKDVHYATCTRRPPEYQGDDPCKGCAPAECREGSLICDRCFGRMRGLLQDVPDLLARLRSIADPAKATPTDQAPSGRTSTEPPAPVGADILDAIAIVQVAALWSEEHLRAVANHRLEILALGELLLERHPEVDGLREHWSVQDAVDRWGVERRDRNTVPWADDEPAEELTAEAVREWGDPVMTRGDIAKRIGRSERTLQIWEKRELITRVHTSRERQKRTAWFRLSEVLAVWEREGANA